MPKRRDLVAMSDAEMWEFIETQKSVQVATLNKDGSPHLTTLWFAVQDGAIVLETFTKSQKIVNLKRDPRIALLLETGEKYNELRGVSINARWTTYTASTWPSCCETRPKSPRMSSTRPRRAWRPRRRRF